jgi:3-hydroxyisobutyrate dehydrogenase-like beta-hydroxyacid dehydrogenase
MGNAVESVGIIGLGKMGAPISRRMVAAGYRVVGYDADAEAVRAASAWQVRPAPDAKALAAATDVSLLLVGFDEQVRTSVLHPERGVLSGARPGHVVLVGSTTSPALSQEIGRVASDSGVHVLDATLCRGEAPAAEGTLLVMGGGDGEVFEHVRPVLESFASDIHLLGDLGAGQVGKMLNNYLLWLSVVGDYEAMCLGQRLGLDLTSLRAALLKSSGANWALETWNRSRPMPWAEKDMAILLDAAEEADVPVPTAEHVANAIAAIKAVKNAWLEGEGRSRSMAELVEAVGDEGLADAAARLGTPVAERP